MRSPFAGLVRFYVTSVYGLHLPSGRAGSLGAVGAAPAATMPGAARALGIGAPAGASAAKRGADLKKIFKTIGIAALVVLVVADIGVLFVAMNVSMYEALKPAGLQGLMLLNAATSASMIVFLLGFVTALSTYCLSQAETGVLAMPVKSRSLLGAKYIVVYLSEFAFAFLLVAIASVIYGVMERPSAEFYLYALAEAVAIPLLPLAAAYFLIVPIMSAGRFLRNKNALIVIGGVVGLVFSLAFNLYVQSAMSRLSDPAWILANYAGPESIVARIGSAYPPTYLAWKSLSSGGLAGALYALANLAFGLGAATAVVLALGPAYAKSLVGFDEMRLRRLADARSYIDRRLRRRPALVSSLLREIRMMNREPMYLLNGPFIVVLMPVILAVMYIAQRDQLGGLLAQLGDFGSGPYALLACAAFGSFLGTSMSISCTALSRDAKALPYIKALPLGYGTYMLAKLAHALVFSVFGVLVGVCAGVLVLGLGFLDFLGALFIGLGFSTFMNAAGLWLDTANPRLKWDNPIAAMKQNVNAVIAILGSMGLLAALGALSAVLDLGKGGFVAAYGGAFAALSALAIAAFPRYAERTIAALET